MNAHVDVLTRSHMHAPDFLSFPGFFFSHLPGIISLSNPFPYIKSGFRLHAASSAQQR